MATGVGMSVANRAVDAVMGPRQTEVVHTHQGAPPAAAPAKCLDESNWLKQCMDKGSEDCSKFQDMLQTCRAGA
jgi:hypothetical protein